MSEMYRKIKLSDGRDIHVAADDGAIRTDIGDGTLSAVFRLAPADAEALGRALINVAEAEQSR